MVTLTRKELSEQIERIGIHAPSEASSITRDYRGYCIEHYINDNDSLLRKYFKRVVFFLKY